MSNSPSHSARTARLEFLEPRLVLSAQSPLELQIEDSATLEFVESQEYVEEAPVVTVADVHDFTGVGQVQSSYGFSGANQTVAVIDTGIAYDHFALGGGYGSSYRVVGGWDFAENDANPYDDGPAGFHGTHVAGIISSDADQAMGVAYESDLVALRVFDDYGQATFEWVEQALQWVADHQYDFENPITTVNLSLGAELNSELVPNWAMLEDEFQVLESRGIFISVAAGNSFEDYGEAGLSYPAVSPNVVPVASVDNSGQMSDFSQRNDRVLAAPGEQILSAVPNHLFGSTQASSRFLALSGTSMAAPYVAGASMLLREAMEFAGTESVTQDLLYDHLRDTADTIWDAATNSSYLRINLQRAIDSLLVDEVSDTPHAATSLGTLSNSLSWEGRIETLQDQDAFSFVAAANGTVTLRADATHDLLPRLTINGQEVSASDGEWTFDVEAGQVVNVILGTGNGIGYYDVTAELDTDAQLIDTQLGAVYDSSLDNIQINGEHWIQLRTTTDGRLTAVVDTAQPEQLTQLVAYDLNGNQIGTAVANETGLRLDLEVSREATVLLQLVGNEVDVDVQIQNLIRATDERVTIFGTAGDDQLTFVQDDGIAIELNGINYSFDNSDAQTYVFVGRAGTDQVDVQLDEGDSISVFRNDRLSSRSSGILFATNTTEQVTINGGGGYDRVIWRDTDSRDTIVSSATSTNFTNNLVQHQVNDVDRVVAIGGTGDDSLTMRGTDQSERFAVNGNGSASLRNDEFLVIGRGFRSVEMIAGSSDDVVVFTSNNSGSQFVLEPTLAFMNSIELTASARGFSRAIIQGRGGADELTFFKANGDVAAQNANNRFVMRGSDYRFVAVEMESVNDGGVSAGTVDGLVTHSKSESVRASEDSPVDSSVEGRQVDAGLLALLQRHAEGQYNWRTDVTVDRQLGQFVSPALRSHGVPLQHVFADWGRESSEAISNRPGLVHSSSPEAHFEQLGSSRNDFIETEESGMGTDTEEAELLEVINELKELDAFFSNEGLRSQESKETTHLPSDA